MKFLKILIVEGRKEDLRKKYLTKFNSNDLDFILNISDLQDYNHKYTDFVLKHTDGDGELNTYEIEKLVELIKDFDKHQSQLEKKDINQYTSVDELERALDPIIEKQKEKLLEKQVDKIYEDDRFLVVRPKTLEASCKYGSNTKWCTTSKTGDHFQRYTTGSQSLYYIINKAKSTNQNYSKIALHFDGGGNPRYYDTKDALMTEREIDVLNYAFPDMFEAINEHYKKVSVSAQDIFLNEVFNSYNTTRKIIERYLGVDNNLAVTVEGFETINDLGPGHAEGKLDINLNINLIDSYQIFITYKALDSKSFSASIGFMGNDHDSDYFIDLGLEGWGFDSKYIIQGFAENTAASVRNHIANRVLDHIRDMPELQEKILGSTRVWRPSLGYGYTFGKNKGLIKKMVDWLDAGNEGTRIDFLQYLGTIQKVTKDGKTFYKRPNSTYLYKPKDLRGQYSSFFASAVLAGIIRNIKKGKNYIISKGPNFDAFKSGELKAL